MLAVLLTFAVYQHFWAKRISAESTTQTRILIPLYSGATSPNTEVLFLENTGEDPYGTTAASGTCTIDVYSQGAHGSGTLPPVPAGKIAVIQPGIIEGIVPSISSSLTGTPISPGYMFLTCNFPYAHAQVEFLDPSTNAVVAVIPGYIIPPNRSYATGPEQLLQ